MVAVYRCPRFMYDVCLRMLSRSSRNRSRCPTPVSTAPPLQPQPVCGFRPPVVVDTQPVDQ